MIASFEFECQMRLTESAVMRRSDMLSCFTSAALGGVPVHHGDLHPGTCSARPQGKPGDDSGLKAVYSGETNT